MAVAWFCTIDAAALSTNPDIVEPGDTLSFLIPVTNGGTNASDLERLRVEVVSSPGWLKISENSVIGPINLPAGETMTYRLDYEVGAEYSQNLQDAELVVAVRSDTADLHAAQFVWHFRTSNGFFTYNSECLDGAGNSFGGTISPDNLPPKTSVVFYGKTYSSEGGKFFVSTATGIGLDSIDQFMEDAITSEVAFIGYAINPDPLPTSIGELMPFVSTFSISSEGAHSIVYASSDNANNVEAFKTLNVTVDGTAPRTDLSVLGSSSTNAAGDLVVSTGSYIVLTGTDSAAGLNEVRYSLDGADYVPFAAGFKLEPGGHSLVYFGVDNVDNAEAPHVINIISEVTRRDFQWTGLGRDTNWHNPANWNINGLPNVYDNVTINANTSVVVYSSYPAIEFGTLSLGTSGCASPVGLNIYKAFSLRNSTITINSCGKLSQATTDAMEIGWVAIRTGGVLTHNENNTSRQYVISLKVEKNLFLDPGASINVNAKGFGQSSGPGAGPATPLNGAGYGGLPSGYSPVTGPTYGSLRFPVDLGSGGGGSSTPKGGVRVGGHGGGAVLLEVGGEFSLNGSVTANGGDGSSGSAPGSGGSVNISASVLSGSGSVSAKSGDGVYYTSGGGRIAIKAVLEDRSSLNTNASNGAYGASYPLGYVTGGAGTIYRTSPSGEAELLVNSDFPPAGFTPITADNLGGSALIVNSFRANNAAIRFSGLEVIRITGAALFSGAVKLEDSGTQGDFPSGDTLFPFGSDITITTMTLPVNSNLTLMGSKLHVSSLTALGGVILERYDSGCWYCGNPYIGSILEQTSDALWTIGNLTIKNGSVLTHKANTDSQKYFVNIKVLGDLLVEAGGAISADGKGFAANYGPGRGWFGRIGTGAGYGGVGGKDLLPGGVQGGAIYGALSADSLGSGGGGSNGGIGGGRIALVVGGAATINGAISANGYGGGTNSGGGSGGGINISAGTMLGSGFIAAQGGSGGEYCSTGGAAGGASGGGGGRISIYNLFNGTVNVRGGGVGSDCGGGIIGLPPPEDFKAQGGAYGTVGVFLKNSTYTILGDTEAVASCTQRFSLENYDYSLSSAVVAQGTSSSQGLAPFGNFYKIPQEDVPGYYPPLQLTVKYSTTVLSGLGLFKRETFLYQYSDNTGWIKVPGQERDYSRNEIGVQVSTPGYMFRVFGELRDTVPPITRADVFGGGVKEADGILSIGVNSAVILNGIDPVVNHTASGVVSTQYRVDPEWYTGFQTYTAPFNPGCGQHTIEFKSLDGAGNWEISVSTVVQVDCVPPAAISDFSSEYGYSGSGVGDISLAWTAVGEDNLVGTAKIYDLRYSTRSLTNDNEFTEATALPIASTPNAAGYSETFTAEGLPGGATYYFGIKSMDRVGNASPLSNIASVFVPYLLESEAQIGGSPEVSLFSPITPSLVLLDTTSGRGYAVVGEAQGRGLLPVSNLYEIGPDGNYSPPVVLTFNYSTSTLAALDVAESGIDIYELFVSSGWVKLNGQIDPVAHTITANVYSISSIFGIFGKIKDVSAPVTKLVVDGPSFTGSDGKTYISTSVLIGLISEDAATYGSGIAFTEFRVDAGTVAPFSPYMEPFTLSAGLHFMEFRSADKAGNVEVTKSTEMFADGEPPAAWFSLSGGTHTAGGLLYASASSTVTLRAFDAASGLKELLFSLNGATNAAVSPAELPLSVGGGNLILYRAVDNVGNAGPEGRLEVLVDTAAPMTVFDPGGVSGDNGWYVSPVSIAVNASDALSGVKEILYDIEGGGFSLYGASFTVVPEGAHSLTAYAVDNVLNKEVARTFSFKIDMSTPLINYAHLPAENVAGWNNLPVVVSFAGTDSVSGIEYCSSSFTVIDEGKDVPVSGYCRDFAGWSSTAAFTVNIDTTPPVVTYAAEPAPNSAGWNNSDITLKFTCSDALSGVGACPVDMLVYREGLGISTSVAASDNAGNVGRLLVGGLNIDRSAPVTQAVVEGELRNGWYISDVRVSLTFADTLSGVENRLYSLDGGVYTAYSAPVTVSADGRHSISYYAVDGAGNSAAVKTVTFGVDRTSPAVVISSPAAGAVYRSGGAGIVIGFSAADALDSAPVSSAALVQVLDKGRPLGGGVAVVQVVNGQALDPLNLDDGLWRLEVTAMDAAGNSTQAVSGVFEIVHDTIAPVTTLAIGEPQFNNGTVFISSVTPLLLSVTDDLLLPGDGLGTGVAKTYSSLDGGVFAAVSGAVYVVSEGAHTLSYYSTDNAGNIETTKVAAFSVDVAPPASELVLSSTSGGVLLPGGSVGFIAQDAGSLVAAIHYSVDGSTPVVFTSGFMLTVGAHNIGWWSVDNLGNTEPARGAVVQVAAPSTGTVRVVSLNFDPEVINLKSEGKWVTATLTASSATGAAFNEGPIRITKINDVAISTPIYAAAIHDEDDDDERDDEKHGLQHGRGEDDDEARHGRAHELTVKFDRQALIAVLPVDARVKITVEGSFDDGAAFVAYDYVRVIKPGHISKGKGGKWKHKSRACVDIGPKGLKDDAEISIIASAERDEERRERSVKASARGFGRRGEPFEFGPDGTVFDEPVEIALPYETYDAKAEKLQVAYWNPSSKDWEPLASTIDPVEKVVKAKVGHFSLYQVVAAPLSEGKLGRTASVMAAASAPQVAGPSAEFVQGEIYVYPNPAKGGEVPVFHIECGMADTVDIKVYAISGREAHEATLTVIPMVVDQRYAYEYAWRGHIPSGVYLYSIEARKDGRKIRKTGKFAVVR